MKKTKTSLLRAIGTVVRKSKVRQICENAEFSEEEMRIMLDHYCTPNIPAEQLAEELNISIDQLNLRKEWLAYKFDSICADGAHNLNFFDIIRIAQYMLK